MAEARSKVFGGWPEKAEVVPPDLKEVVRFSAEGTGYFVYEFTSQAGVHLRLWGVVDGEVARQPVTLHVVDQSAWDAWVGKDLAMFNEIKELAKGLDRETEKKLSEVSIRLRDSARKLAGPASGPVVFLAPRGVGPTAWPANKDVQIRRRFALLGQTLDGMRAWDVARAAALIPDLPYTRNLPVRVTAQGQAAPLALWAAVFEPTVKEVTLIDPPTAWRDAPAFQGVERVLGMPQAAALLYPRKLTLIGTPKESWAWTVELGRILDSGGTWPVFQDRIAP